ncbi:MAG: hypothetical protein JSV24_09155 [Bacteroidales bacterium]|nr:MAG: hypothetical protein JSV24_09155 [Bacteroidales bacterium]
MDKEIHKLIEGKEYSFLIEKVLVIPGDGKYYVLADPFKWKHLLKADYYKNYALEPGKDIPCRVDKIDCTGRIYLEPRHPYYKEGNLYNFPLLRYEDRLNPIGQQEKVAVVTDIFKNELTAPCPPGWKEQSDKPEIRCRIERIKKGEIHLALVKRGRRAKNLIPGTRYSFKVKKIARGLDNNKYIILADPHGQKHLLRHDYYLDYEISVGKTIMATVAKLSTDGRVLIEPDHPYLKTGEKYTFHIVKKVTGKEHGYLLKPCLIVKDHKGIHHQAYLNPGQEKLFKAGDKVICQVEKMKKGKPILKITGTGSTGTGSTGTGSD